MKRSIATLIVVASLAVAGNSYAQETTPGPGTVEVSIIPSGGTWFLEKDSAPGFGNYDVGGAVAFNFSRIVGVEGEVTGSFGTIQQLGGLFGDERSPHILSYTGNVVANMPGRSLVPYATAGIGGLSIYSRQVLGQDSATHLTGNVGGGMKWFAPNGRWGLRGDYRFLMTGSNSSSAFFGPDNRYAHRIYGAVVINAVK